MLDQVTNFLLNAVITDVTHTESHITLQLGENKLWVHTAWRLEREGRIVVGNDNLVELLYHEDYKYDCDLMKAFIKDCLKDATIVDVKYTEFNELILTTSNSFTFRSFQTNGDDEDDADNFQLYIPKKRYLVYPTKVELEDLHQFYKD